MLFKKLKKKKNSKSRGFTLIETLVSITLFAFVVTITLTAILTVLDINKKSRTLMAVMNNLNFAVDSMTLSFKTGLKPKQTDSLCFETNQVDYSKVETAAETIERLVPTTYCIKDDGITKKRSSGGETYYITSGDVTFDINKSYFKVQGEAQGVNQPILFMHLVGEVRPSEKVGSSFRIQTSVSQRDLNF